ncbi:hypothetical protein M2302_004526 [Micromonospora sp. A200]|uniref:8-oxoguanine DNA glycosylase OGG fold protein n=1 Tax=Micromonospora sp. A200 TaxID=2940568 RepID=UPI002472E9D4|nr:hypothetical protein [Micromonospora sp. A200]MDH6464328.1 hypothetical protein [Micromonospora sp. A200]
MSVTDPCVEAIKLPEDASAYDAGVVNEGLRRDERDWLVRQRRVWEAGHGGTPGEAERLVDAHRILVIATNWERFGDDLRVAGSDQPLLVSRGDVTGVARQCRERGDWLPLLVTSFAWGWGTRSIGPTRLSWVFHGSRRIRALPTVEIGSRLAAAVNVLDRQSAEAAYRWLLKDGHIPALGPAFFTKFLYFASRAGGGRYPALILDARLARRMQWFWERRAGEEYAVGGQAARWLWRGPRWSAYRYQVYRAFICRATAQLSEPGERWTTELMELLLFQCDPREALGGTVSRT